MRHCWQRRTSQPDSGTGRSPVVPQFWCGRSEILVGWPGTDFVLIQSLDTCSDKVRGGGRKTSFLLHDTSRSNLSALTLTLRNEQGKNACSLTTYYSAGLSGFLFFLQQCCFQWNAECVGAVEQSDNGHYLGLTPLWVSSLDLGDVGKGAWRKNCSYWVPPDLNSFTLSLIMTSEGLPLLRARLSKRPSRHVLNT